MNTNKAFQVVGAFVAVLLLTTYQISLVYAASAPSVTTVGVSNITATTATVTVSLDSENDSPVTDTGVLVGYTFVTPTLENEQFDDAYGSSSRALGNREFIIKWLPQASHVYVRAYSENAQGISYGDVLEFDTLAPAGEPTVTTGEATNVNQLTADFLTTIISDNGNAIYSRGIAYSNVNPLPSPSDFATSGYTSTNQLGPLTMTLDWFDQSTHYYARAFAINSGGIGYGNVVEFDVPAALDEPTVTTGAITNIGTNSADVAANIVSDNGNAITSAGIMYSSVNPIPKRTDWSSTDAESTTTIENEMNFSLAWNIKQSTHYYARAFAENSGGIGYGNVVEFDTFPLKPSVTTGAISAITTVTATVSTNISNDNGGAITATGIAFSDTISLPTIANSTVMNESDLTIGDKSFDITELQGSTHYYLRAFASNSAGTSYGSVVEFTTLTPIPPDTLATVTSGAGTSVGETTETVPGNVSSDGGAVISERGVVYSILQSSPTTSDSKLTTTGTTGSLSVSITGLTGATHYYARVYAINLVGTAYGNVIEFTTAPPSTSATVITGAASNIGETTATVEGNVTTDGGAVISERGIVYSKLHSIPTTIDSRFITTGSTGGFSASITGLTQAATYYARAYVINSKGTAYGSVVTIRTLDPATLRNVYFTFGKLRYNKYAAVSLLRSGDMTYIKNYDPKKLKLLQVFLYDYAKKGNQGYTKSRVTTYSMFLRTNYNLQTGKRYAYVMKFQDRATGIIATKYFVFYTTKTWLGKSVL